MNMQIGLNPLDSCLFSLRSPSIFRQSFGDKDEATPRIQPAPIHPRRRSSGCALPCLIPYLPPLVLDTANILLKLNAGAALKVCSRNYSAAGLLNPARVAHVRRFFPSQNGLFTRTKDIVLSMRISPNFRRNCF